LIWTPNVKKLIIRKVSLDAIPPGGGMQSGIDFLTSGKIKESFKEAEVWVGVAIQTVRSAKDPNPYKTATDEEIAGELMARIEEKERCR
jgi:hypothetical protein